MDSDTQSGNRLGGETSPYLLQHKDNPVHWFPWGDEAFARARADGKPILLSIGYAACHWCHVMAAESFEDQTIAGLMNQHFVNIKVDREERPDLDQIYQAALAMLSDHGGWPLTMFLTSKGEPFWGGTYFPPVGRNGRPGFPDILRGVAETYRREPDKVASNVEALRASLSQLSKAKPAEPIPLSVLDRVGERLVREVDPFHGGIGTAPKFPQVPLFELFWRAWLRTRRRPYRNAVTTTLTHMCQGGIYDHLGGGFARYSTDEEWLVPHFEKMLYDNAQLIDLLTLVWQETREPLYASRVAETVDWVLREMRAEADDPVCAGFASTLDADSEHEEGKYYVWTEAEVDEILGADSARFKQVYDVQRHGNWEGKTILNRCRDLTLNDEATETDLQTLRARLKQVRDRRVRPGWDDKVLADWNGMMIAALANAAIVFDQPSWLEAAERAFRFVQSHMTDGARVYHSWRQGRLGSLSTLDDHANMCRAALGLFEATGQTSYLEHARRWVAEADRWFWDESHGGYFLTPADGESLIVRPKPIHDNAVPSGNGVMARVLATLFHVTGDTGFRQRADQLIAACSGEVSRNFFPLATLFNAVEMLEIATVIVIVGDQENPATQDLRRVVLDRTLPNRFLVTTADADLLPPGHPAAGKPMVEKRATAYVCQGMVCSPPLLTPDDLARRLS